MEIQINGFPNCEPGCWSLFVAATREDGADALRDSLRAAEVPFAEPFPSVLCLELTPQSLRKTTRWWSELDRSELESIRCHLTARSEAPNVARLMQSQRLSKLLAWINGQWLVDVLKGNRLITYFQPIVATCDPTHIFAYECLLRGRERDGEMISPYRLFTAARDTGLLNSLDAAARLTAIECFRNSCVSAEAKVFVNVNPRSLEDPSRSLNGTVQAILSSGLDPDRFVFEVVESDKVDDSDSLMQILDFCREAGCRVALDDLGAGYNSLNLLARIKPDFIKLDMDLIRDVDQDAYKGRVAGKLLELAKELKVKTVAEGIETEGEWQWAIRNGADYSQGYFFAKPAAIPPKPEVDIKSITNKVLGTYVGLDCDECVDVRNGKDSNRREVKGIDK